MSVFFSTIVSSVQHADASKSEFHNVDGAPNENITQYKFRTPVIETQLTS